MLPQGFHGSFKANNAPWFCGIHVGGPGFCGGDLKLLFFLTAPEPSLPPSPLRAPDVLANTAPLCSPFYCASAPFLFRAHKYTSDMHCHFGRLSAQGRPLCGSACGHPTAVGFMAASGKAEVIAL